MYVLDTNVISEMRRRKPHGGVVAWLKARKESEISIAAPTIGEIQIGIELTRSNNPQKAVEIERWLQQVLETYRILAADGEVFRTWARMMSGQLILPLHFGFNKSS